MNTNLMTTDACAQRTDLLATDQAVKTARRSISALQPVMRLMLALTVLMGLMAARPAHAQYLNLGWETNILTLTDSSTKKSTTAYLGVIQDKYGNLTGGLDINNTNYKVTGTLEWYGPSDPNWYWLNITATYSSPVIFISSVTYNLSGWVYDYGVGDGNILYYQSDYTWNSRFGFEFSSGGGTYTGFGFPTPQ